MLMITLASLFSSGLAVSGGMANARVAGRKEIGLLKALGAGQLALSGVFITESVLLACAGGLVGFAGGTVLVPKLGYSIFGSAISVGPILLPVILAIAILVTFVGSAAAIRRAVKYDPVRVLRG